ncbi:MAG: glmu3, partial [Chlamydiia bacterium]|nr:glmu3 [Chlamydiia bacterium]
MKKELITSYSPLSSYHASGNKEIASFGKELLSKGKVGAVVLAGGQGTRLGIEGPKGTLPFSLIKQKSLFQLLSEKTLACSKQVGYDLQIAFMTSEENHATTVQFFEKHAFFGLKESQVSFFTQSSLPLTYEDGTTVFNSLGKELTAADGNGSFFWNFTESSLKTTWENLGIEYVTVMVVDNPLIDPFDAEVIGVTAIHSADATIEGVEKIHPTENVGCIAEQNGKLTVIEYSEIDPAEKIACTPQGKLKYRVANTSYFCFSMPFIKKVSALSKNS